MLPHAGYVFSGKTAGKTLSYAKIKKNVIILGPNHTGIGTNFSVWHEGRWDLPLGYLDVNNELSNRLLENIQELVPDFSGHLREHSLEVIIPFFVENRFRDKDSANIHYGTKVRKIDPSW